jgi:hypothetical protein
MQDGSSNYLKGLMLILFYLIVAASFFVHIDPSSIGELSPLFSVEWSSSSDFENQKNGFIYFFFCLLILL